jgi:membrane-bound lytic murein transglycosylase D
MRNLEKLGFTRPDPRRRHMLAEVSVGAGTDLRRLASKTGLSWEQFSALNPAFRRPVSSPSLKTVAYVPVEKEKIALAWLASRESRIYANWRNYKVRKGDTLAQVAKAHGTTVALLRQANNLQGNALKQGNILLVPANAKAAQQAAAAGKGEAAGAKKDTRAQQAGASVQTDARTGATYVVVRSGDTLYSLARDHGSSVDELRALNKLKPDSSLQIGQKILLAQGKQASGQRQATAPAAGKAAAGKPAAGKPAAGKAVGGKPAAGATGAKKKDAESRFAVVQTGDTLYSLAKANNTTVDALKKLNGLDAQGARLRPGQLIRLP